MKAEYDSEADALQIDLVDDVTAYDWSDEPVIGTCWISVTPQRRVVAVELLSPRDRLEELVVAAERHDLDGEALVAAAKAALAAPDREVAIEVSSVARA